MSNCIRFQSYLVGIANLRRHVTFCQICSRVSCECTARNCNRRIVNLRKLTLELTVSNRQLASINIIIDVSAIQYIITFSYKTATINSSCVVVHHRAAFFIAETTAVDNQFTAIIIFNGIHATQKTTIVDSQFRSSLIDAIYIVLTRIRASRIVIIAIYN